jgi:hypothetical protein
MMTVASAPILTPQGHLLFAPAPDAPTLPEAVRQRLTDAFARGSGHGLLQLGPGEVVMERMCRPRTGLFPAPAEIKFTCSCPDWAGMCKHVAAVFYGISARLDAQPELLFTLRKVDAKELVSQAGEVLPQEGKRTRVARVLDDSEVSKLFGLEMAEPFPPQRSRTKSVATKAKQPAKDKARKRGTPPR